VTKSAKPDTSWMARFSSFPQLVRVTAWIFRFYYHCRKTSQYKNTFLTSDELRTARLRLIRMVQCESFREDITEIQHNLMVCGKSHIKSLAPFLDQQGMLRVGGRLRQAKINNDSKHPLLLPTDHHVSRLLVRYEHERHLHAYPTL